MTKFIIDHNDYGQLLQEMRIILGGTLEKDVYTFDAAVAAGTVRHVILPGALELLVSDYVMNTDITWQKLTTLPEMYILRMNLIENMAVLDVHFDHNSHKDTSGNYAAVLLTTSKSGLAYTVKKGSRVKSINMNISPEKLKSYFPDTDITRHVHSLFLKGAGGYNLFPMGYQQRDALTEAIGLPSSDPLYTLMLSSRVYEIAGAFFEQLTVKTSEDITAGQLQDMERITELDFHLLNDLTKDIPSTESLADQVHMSAAKFKALFKKIYGQSVYDYYNTARLNKARRQLMLGAINIKEAASNYGFSTTAHFSTAFKKCFGFPPSALKTQVLL
jgi:AraC-like DNA-binding protein